MISLKKNEGISLRKLNNENSLKSIAMGLGWEAIKKKQRTFWGGTKEVASESVDLDASCLCFNANKEHIESVWFRNLCSSDMAIKHSGDNRTGDGDGDDETISVNLSKLNPAIKTIVFTVNSFTGQSFEKISGITCNIYNIDNGKKSIGTYTENIAGTSTALVVCKCDKVGEEWEVTPIGKLGHGRTINDIQSLINSVL